MTADLRIDWIADDGVAVPRFGRERARKLLGLALAQARRKGAFALTVRFVGDEAAARLHGEHFDDPTTTDVMTFPDGSVDPGSGRTLLGDLAVCVDVARREAAARRRTVADETLLYILHGMLHLLDHDDRTPALRRRMWAAQVDLLGRIGVALESDPG